jgi:hypothetical protein
LTIEETDGDDMPCGWQKPTEDKDKTSKPAKIKAFFI